MIESRQGAYLTKGAADGVHGRQHDDPRLGVWLAPGIFDENGQCLLDEMVSTVIPHDFESLDIQVVRLHAADDQKPKYSTWFDIKPRTGTKQKIAAMETDRPDGVGDCGYSVQHYYATSRAAARERLKELRDEEVALVPARELPDAAQPPEGVERWYVIRSQGQGA